MNDKQNKEATIAFDQNSSPRPCEMTPVGFENTPYPLTLHVLIIFTSAYKRTQVDLDWAYQQKKTTLKSHDFYRPPVRSDVTSRVTVARIHNSPSSFVARIRASTGGSLSLHPLRFEPPDPGRREPAIVRERFTKAG